MIILFDVSVTYTDGRLVQVQKHAKHLYQLIELLQIHARNEGAQFKRIFSFNNIELVPDPQA